MATRALYHPRDAVVDFADLPRWLYDELASWHGRIKATDRPVLTCLGNGESLHVYRHDSGRYFVRHFANGHGDRHHHGALSTISDEHRRQAEYSLRAAVTAGYSADLEVSTGNHTRLDVGIRGACNVGLEIQRSKLTTPQAKRRATSSFKAGWPTAWISDSERDPAWMDRVPTARLITRGGWDEKVLDPNTASVSITTLKRERDPSRRTGWWYRREPKAVLLDELAYLMPAGDIIPVAVGTRGLVVLAEKAAAEILDSCTFEGAHVWNPAPTEDRETKEAVQQFSRDCHHGGHFVSDLPQSGRWVPPIMLRPLREPPVMPEPVSAPDRQSGPRCCCCSGLLMAPASIARGYCERCRIDQRGVAS